MFTEILATVTATQRSSNEHKTKQLQLVRQDETAKRWNFQVSHGATPLDLRQLQRTKEVMINNTNFDSSRVRAAERITAHNVAMRSFLLRLIDPEDLGLAVTNEVRVLAKQLVNMPREGEHHAR